MRILHTSDWHLGHTLRDLSREAEHAAFLAWLLDRIKEHKVDALLVAGDVFHSANPPAAAQSAWYAFLATARKRFPALDIVVIGGNHDSGARLDAAVPLLELDRVRIRVVGGVPRTPSGEIDVERLVVPLTDGPGNVCAQVVAMPYLRQGDLPAIEGECPDRLIAGVRRLYDAAFEVARRAQWPGQALLAMGHCYLADTSVSADSERKILGGNLHGLPSDLFPADCAYTALGHLHLAQPIGRENVRYSGSPIPLSMTESGYAHQVVLVDIENGRFVRQTPLFVPRLVDMIRLPEGGPRPLEDVLLRLSTLPPRDPARPDPFLEVHVQVDRFEPGLKRRVEEALEGRAARLVHLALHGTESRVALADRLPGRRLEDLDPTEVFIGRYRQEYGTDPADELLAAFAELREDVQREAVA